MKGKSARIIFKVNSLIDQKIIQALYEASMAGVVIDLIIRGVCGLRPGVNGISTNIHVRSILGRFLEHTRVYYFENDGKPEVYAGSADLMPRNLYRRVEVAYPLDTKSLKARIISDLNGYLDDNIHAWVLREDGSYDRLTPGKDKPFSMQHKLLSNFSED